MILVIVESPTKAKTISKFLGDDYKVESSYGHIRDLPKSKLGIDVEHDFEPQYIIPIKARKTVKQLKEAAKKSDSVSLATDEDREGEAIAWHLKQALGLDEKNTQRIVFHEITKTAIDKALQNPRSINDKLVNAQQARRVLDRLVGYKLSPFLWKKIMGGLSAGRVQSVAVRLIVEREQEIRAFKPETYFTVKALLSHAPSKTEIEVDLAKIDGKALEKLAIKTEDEAKRIVADIEAQIAELSLLEEKEVIKNPLPPFI